MITPKFTHYSYIAGPMGIRSPTGLYVLTHLRTEERRHVIHRLLKKGELLAQVPFGCTIANVADLVKALDWLRDNPRDSQS